MTVFPVPQLSPEAQRVLAAAGLAPLAPVVPPVAPVAPTAPMNSNAQLDSIILFLTAPNRNTASARENNVTGRKSGE